MSQVQTTSPARKLIPKQPECNIGTSGHVDHGKCLTWDQYVLVGNKIKTGAEIFRDMQKSGVLLARVDKGTVYRTSNNEVVSIDDQLRLTKADSLFYVQHYEGPVVQVKTRTGRAIAVTPEHPLLINRKGAILWCKASELRRGDHVAFAITVPVQPLLESRDPWGKVEESNSIVRFAEYVSLREKTNGFTNFQGLDGFDIDRLRILAGFSRDRLAKDCHMHYSNLREILTGRRLAARYLQSFATLFQGQSFNSLRPGEWLSEPLGMSRHGARKLREAEIDSDLVKFFAFVWAEGTSSPARIAITRTVQVEMLKEVLEIAKRRFGIHFKAYPRGEYHLNCKPLIDYLSAKFSFAVGNKMDCQIPDWVIHLPENLRATFLRWFFTLGGEFNRKSGQIGILQKNPRNIVILGYALQSFGVIPQFGKKHVTTKKGIQEYSRISVSGRANLKLFSEIIGFEDPRISNALESYLASVEQSNKLTDLSIPIEIDALSELVAVSGVLREGFGGEGDVSRAKDMSWYKAYEAARISGRISREKLLALIDSVDSHINQVEKYLIHSGKSRAAMRRHMRLAKISLEIVSGDLGITRKVLNRMIRTGRHSEVRDINNAVRRITLERLRISKSILGQLRRLAGSNLAFDPIKELSSSSYSGYIYDLTVPTRANFVAGLGAIVCHNSTITQSITGVWTSAHSEELKRGITIKVGYADAAFYKCPGVDPPTCYRTDPQCPDGGQAELLRAVSFVDTPGHESLMTNMLAGAALMDGAILVIAANEPVPMPQTREHLQALQMLEMKRLVVVQNKIDLVDEEKAKANYEAIKEFVANTVAETAPIIPISAQQRINIDALIEAIQERIPTPARDPSANPLMPVLRSFDVNLPGTDISELKGGVLGGSLVKGEFHVGDDIEILPGILDEKTGKFAPLVTAVSGLGTGAGITDKVGPGGLVAVGTLLDPTLTRSDQMVGSVVGKPGTLPPVWSHVTLELQLFERAVGSLELVKVEKTRVGETLRINVGTASTLGTITSARDSIAEMDLRKPVSAEQGSRLAVSRRIAERWRLIGAGAIK